MDFEKIFPKITDDFGYWFAGLTDGEGCFSICEVADTAYKVSFMIRLRADDISVLKDVSKTLGVGRIGITKGSPRKNGEKGNPIAQFWVSGRHELPKLVEFFERYHLRSKKHNDFNIWKLAVKEYAKRDYSRKKLECYQKSLQSGRSYNNQVEVPSAVEADDAQLIFFAC